MSSGTSKPGGTPVSWIKEEGRYKNSFWCLLAYRVYRMLISKVFYNETNKEFEHMHNMCLVMGH